MRRYKHSKQRQEIYYRRKIKKLRRKGFYSGRRRKQFLEKKAKYLGMALSRVLDLYSIFGGMSFE